MEIEEGLLRTIDWYRDKMLKEQSLTREAVTLSTGSRKCQIDLDACKVELNRLFAKDTIEPEQGTMTNAAAT